MNEETVPPYQKWDMIYRTFPNVRFRLVRSPNANKIGRNRTNSLSEGYLRKSPKIASVVCLPWNNCINFDVTCLYWFSCYYDGFHGRGISCCQRMLRTSFHSRWPSSKADVNPVDYWVCSVEQEKVCQHRLLQTLMRRVSQSKYRLTAVGQRRDKTRTLWTQTAGADYAWLTLQAYRSNSCFSFVLIKCDMDRIAWNTIVRWFYPVMWVDLKGAMNFCFFPCSVRILAGIVVKFYCLLQKLQSNNLRRPVICGPPLRYVTLTQCLQGKGSTLMANYRQISISITQCMIMDLNCMKRETDLKIKVLSLNWIETKLEEASTKVQKTHAGTVFAPRDLNLWLLTPK